MHEITKMMSLNGKVGPIISILRGGESEWQVCIHEPRYREVMLVISPEDAKQNRRNSPTMIITCQHTLKTGVTLT